MSLRSTSTILCVLDQHGLQDKTLSRKENKMTVKSPRKPRASSLKCVSSPFCKYIVKRLVSHSV